MELKEKEASQRAKDLANLALEAQMTRVKVARCVKEDAGHKLEKAKNTDTNPRYQSSQFLFLHLPCAVRACQVRQAVSRAATVIKPEL